ncbi:MAG: DUF1232 domain-containing protein [Firmicutes bacterium]|nr:DUF1232 domain-containing protein [Bacillota bacterium]
MKFKAFFTLIRRIKAIKYFLRDPSVSKIKKFIIIFGIIYLVSPIDLIPAPVLGFSIIDDLTLWGIILAYLSSELDKYEVSSKNMADILKEKKKFKGKTVIESEGREVKDSEEDNKQ